MLLTAYRAASLNTGCLYGLHSKMSTHQELQVPRTWDYKQILNSIYLATFTTLNQPKPYLQR
uniref:Uncharacterized protein n=1 Tax=Anguilla anguilla TaxID=7936 RepID=A0A0E9WTI2_ANGAN